MSRFSKDVVRLSPQKRELLKLLLQEEGMTPSPFKHIPCRTETDPAPLSFSQERLWFLDQLQPGSAAYNIATAIPITTPLYQTALHESLNEIVRRHEVLRT